MVWFNERLTVLKLHDTCSNTNCCFQKKVTYTPRHFQSEAAGYKNKLQKFFIGTPTAWNNMLKPAVNATVPVTGMVLAANSKNPQVGRGTTKNLQSKSGGKVLPLTVMHGRGLKLRVMWIISFRVIWEKKETVLKIWWKVVQNVKRFTWKVIFTKRNQI